MTTDHWRTLGAMATLFCALAGASGFASAAEEPGPTTATAVLGSAVNGPGYTIDPAVGSDGFMHRYHLRTSRGHFDVVGDRLMRVRLSEVAATRRLQAMSQSDAFKRSFASAATAPVRFGANLLDDPGATVRGSISGIANMFDRAGSAVANIGSSRDGVGSSLLGIDVARRQLAYELGVDPYTDFPPLATALSDMARAMAGGTLTVKALTMAVPGAAGMVVSASSTSTSSRELLRDRTSSQIIEHVRQVLGGLAVPAGVTARFVDNRNYTPTDLLIIATALRDLRARNSAIFVARAAEAVARDEAFFQRSRAELLAAQGRELGLTEFVSVAGFPLNLARDRRVVAVFPFDILAWTERAENAFKAASVELSRTGNGAVLATTGKISPLAQQELGKLGWTLQLIK